MILRSLLLRLLALGSVSLWLFATSAAIPVTGSPATAEESSRSAAAAAFIRRGINQVLDIVKDSGASHDQKMAGLRAVLRDYFDHRTMGRFAAGAYYRRASEPEREAYFRALEDFLLAVYGERMLRYSGEIDLSLEADDIFVVRGTERTSNGDYVVRTHINRVAADRITIDWRLRRHEGNFRIVDVVILNMSQLLVYRREFTSVMRRSNTDLAGLTDVLNRRRRTIMAED